MAEWVKARCSGICTVDCSELLFRRCHSAPPHHQKVDSYNHSELGLNNDITSRRIMSVVGKLKGDMPQQVRSLVGVSKFSFIGAYDGSSRWMNSGRWHAKCCGIGCWRCVWADECCYPTSFACYCDKEHNSRDTIIASMRSDGRSMRSRSRWTCKIRGKSKSWSRRV